MDENKFTFHKDEFGVYVFYAGMNDKVRRGVCNLKINGTIDFNQDVDCVVPPVVRVSSVATKDQVVGYKHKEDGRTISHTAYNAEHQRLEWAKSKTITMEEEVATEIAFRRFEKEWEQETQSMTIHTDHKFEVIDILYPADERLIPLRHFDAEQVNYFRTDGKMVALNLAHQLCKDAGLKHESSEHKRGTYHIQSYGGLEYWEIEGARYGKPTNKLNLCIFTGTLDECRDYINKIEQCVRSCFDEWDMHAKQPIGLTVGMVTRQLDKILSIVTGIDSKVRTRNTYSDALTAIARARKEVIQEGAKALAGEENLDDPLDNAP